MGKCHLEKLKKNKRYLLYAALMLAAVLAVMTMAVLHVQQAKAAEEKTYALTLTTGVSSSKQDLASQIGFIRVKYNAADGSGSHYEYMFPSDGDYMNSLKKAESLGGSSSSSAQLQALGYFVNSYTVAKPFQDYAEDTFLFSTIRDVESFEGVEIYTKGSGTWSCQNIQIYEVDASQVRLRNVGSVSSQYAVDFAGSLKLELSKKNQIFRWTSSGLLKMTTDGGDAAMKAPDTERTRSLEDSEYILRMDIADIYGAGIEALASSYDDAVSGQGFFEALTLKVRYTDQSGCVREVNLPVVTSMLAEALKSDQTGAVSAGRIVGVAQQGQTLAFHAFLPGFQTLESTELIYGYEQAVEAAGISFTGNGNQTLSNRHAERLASSLVTEKQDTLSLTGVSIYRASDTSLTYGFKEGDELLSVTVEGSPIYFYKAQRVDGNEFKYGSQTSIDMQEYGSGAPLLPTDQTERYLVVLRTDSPESAGTTGEVRFKLSYRDLSGTQKESKMMLLSTQCQNYYGYWPGVSENFSYLAGMQPGQELAFVVELSNVDYFNGVTFALDSLNDDWQMAGFTIYKLESLGQRVAASETFSANGQWTNRRYSRIDNVMTQMLNVDQTTLIQAGETRTMDIKSDSTITDDSDDDWSDIRYSMTYEQAKTLGSFIKSRQTYTVAVQVAGDVATSSENGDCGSVNQFFFQLVFEDGTSAMVLANQQLSSDGFRSGTEETFTISTNHDYGDVTAVRIIPEDQDSRSDVFDKLNVDSITVTKDGTDAVSRQWVVGSVGWIDIDYRDEGEDAVGRTGRSMEELARTYPVSYSTDVVNLEFSIATAAYEEAAQLQGTVTGVVKYRDTDGQTLEKEVNLVSAMYKYMNKSVSASSDTSLMFRDSHTDRFMVSLENPAEILSLKLTVNSTQTVTWNIEGVSVKLAVQDSTLQLNIHDEYERVYEGEAQSVCEQASTRTPAYTQLCTAGQAQTVDISFTENQITIEEQEHGKTVSAISRTPQSVNDTLNLYVFMSDAADDVSLYSMKAAVQYTKVYGGSYQTSATLTAAGASNPKMLYAKGLTATNLSVLNSMYLKAEVTGSTGFPSAKVDHAIIQRVRSGVVVETYYLNYGNNNALYGASMRPESLPDTGSEQVVSLSFGADTSSLQLVSENYDVAVAIRYTSSYDLADVSGVKPEYVSPYIYLTDQQVYELKAGKIVDLTFTQPFVSEITGITLATTVTSNADAVARGEAQPIVISVDSAIAATYQVQKEQVAQIDPETGQETTTEQEMRTCTGWYSFASPVTLGADAQTMMRTSADTASFGTVKQLTLQFMTAAAAEGIGSGHNGAVAMTIGYTDPYGISQEITYEDIRSYVTEGDFTDGSTATAKFQLANVAELRWIKLTPKSDDGSGTATWKLSGITGTLKAGSEETSFSRTLDRTFNESEDGKINVNVRVNLVAQTTSLESGNVTVKKVTNDTASLLAESGRPVIITVDVAGSDDGFDVNAEEYSVETDAVKNVNSYVLIDGSTVTFMPPSNYSGEDIYYRVTITSKEVPSCKSVINVTLQHTDQPAAASNSGSSASDTDNTSSSDDSDASSSGDTASSDVPAEAVGDPGE